VTSSNGRSIQCAIFFFWGDNSLCDCPTPCTEVNYALTTSITDWPNPANQLAFYDKYIKPNPQIYGNKFDAYGELEERSGNMTTAQIISEVNRINLIPNNFIQLNVRIMTQNYQKNNDLPAVGWVTLFSDLGGTLKLWMGITVMFAAEVVKFVVAVLTLYFNKAIYHEDANIGKDDDDDDDNSKDVVLSIAFSDYSHPDEVVYSYAFPDYSHPEEDEDVHSHKRHHHRSSIRSVDSNKSAEDKHKKRNGAFILSGYSSTEDEHHHHYHKHHRASVKSGDFTEPPKEDNTMRRMGQPRY